MQICPNCQLQNRDDAAICVQCQEKLAPTKPPKAQTVPPIARKKTPYTKKQIIGGTVGLVGGLTLVIILAFLSRPGLSMTWTSANGPVTYGVLRNVSGRTLKLIKLHPTASRVVHPGGLSDKYDVDTFSIYCTFNPTPEQSIELEKHPTDGMVLAPGESVSVMINGQYNHFDLNDATSNGDHITIEQFVSPDRRADTPAY